MKASIALFAASVGATLTPPLEGYTVVPMTWRGVNETDGSQVSISGTIEEMQDQVKAMGSSINWTRPSTHLSTKARNKGNLECWVGGGGATDYWDIRTGIIYLESITDHLCSASAGPGVCTRISCSWQAAIWLCNDTPSELQHSCPDLASYATDIAEGCQEQETKLYTQGQEFDSDSWNVVVGIDHC
ncbi:hypothetical protein M426DRAFT_27576 [Hypoxylon sp. CI-4A]|nr:hypothetical protein M426DRAFT_27576 [Hypoxylon sp. CI-4A]